MKTKQQLVGSFFVAFLLLSTILFNEKSQAQSAWGLGVSYQKMISDAGPPAGFGIHLDRHINSGLSPADFGLRAYFNYSSELIGSFGVLDVMTDQKLYDYGLAATGRTKVAFIKSYAGVGIGNKTLRRVLQGGGSGFNEDHIYWNLFAGGRSPSFSQCKAICRISFFKTFSRHNA